MKAAFIREFGGTAAVEVGAFPEPAVAAADVLLHVRTASLNHHDVYTTRGEAGRYELPLVLGCDGVGEVLRAPSGSDLSVGDRVVVYPVLYCGDCLHCCSGSEHKCLTFGMVGGERHGTLSERVALPAGNCVRVPAQLSDPMAGSLGVAGLTAWNMVHEEGAVQPGENVLVLGASGGVGVFAVKLLKELGAIVYAVTSKTSKVEFLRAVGADTVFLHKPATILTELSKLPLGGVDVALNYVGGSSWRYVLPAMRRGGRILTCGAVGGPAVQMDQRQIFYKQLRIYGCSMGSRSGLGRLMDFFADHPAIEVPVHIQGGLDMVPEALRSMEQGEVSGKIMIYP